MCLTTVELPDVSEEVSFTKRPMLCRLKQYIIYSIQNFDTELQCATGSKILTEPEPDRIGIILTGTGPDRISSQNKLTGLAGFLPVF